MEARRLEARMRASAAGQAAGHRDGAGTSPSGEWRARWCEEASRSGSTAVIVATQPWYPYVNGDTEGTEMTSNGYLLQTADLRVSRENREILRGVNLVIQPNAVHAVLGPNGSGKSTLAYTLQALAVHALSRPDPVRGRDIVPLGISERASWASPRLARAALEG